VGRIVVVQGDSDLHQVVDACCAACLFSRLLNCGHQQRQQHTNDGHRQQKFHHGECRALSML
jgi:hypothetical protein